MDTWAPPTWPTPHLTTHQGSRQQHLKFVVIGFRDFFKKSNSHESTLTPWVGRLLSLHLVCKTGTLPAPWGYWYRMTGARHLPAKTPRAWRHFLPTSPRGVFPIAPAGFDSSHRTVPSCATSHLLPHTSVICGLSQHIFQLLGSF